METLKRGRLGVMKVTISRFLKKPINDVLKVIVLGNNHGMGEDSAMVAGLDSWQTPWANSVEIDDLEAYISVFRTLMDIHWEVRDKLTDFASNSGPKVYTSESVSLNKKVIGALACVLEQAFFIDAVGRYAVHWSCVVAAIHHSRRIGNVKLGIGFALDLADVAGLSDAKDRLEILKQFVNANGNDPATVLDYIQQWKEMDAILKGVHHAFSIDINSENPLFEIGPVME